MIFYSGARHKHIKYVVRQAEVETDRNGRTLKRTPGVYAVFQNHTFDSKKAQQQLGWSDEVREEVENFLLNHPDSRTANKGQRIYTLAEASVKGTTPAIKSPVEDDEHPCAYLEVNDEGEAQRCAFKSLKGNLYCEEHSNLTNAESA